MWPPVSSLDCNKVSMFWTDEQGWDSVASEDSDMGISKQSNSRWWASADDSIHQVSVAEGANIGGRQKHTNLPASEIVFSFLCE